MRKVLLFMHSKYSIASSIKYGFEDNGFDVKLIDFRSFGKDTTGELLRYG